MKAEILDRVRHADLEYHRDTIPDLAFAPVIATEVANCADDLVVVITDEENPKLVALLGQSKNVLIDENYRGYIPASVQNYPFFLAQIQDQNVLCIDSEAKHLSGKGEKLFVDGKESEFMQGLMKAMENYNDMDNRTKIALKELKEAGILESKELGVTTADGENRTLIRGFCLVNREKLDKLEDKTLADFARRGYLELVYMHLKSLQNFQKLADEIIAKESSSEK